MAEIIDMRAFWRWASEHREEFLDMMQREPNEIERCRRAEAEQEPSRQEELAQLRRDIAEAILLRQAGRIRRLMAEYMKNA